MRRLSRSCCTIGRAHRGHPPACCFYASAYASTSTLARSEPCLRPSARIWAIVLATSSASSLESRLRGVNELTIWRRRTRSISVTKGSLISIFATPQPQNASMLPWPKEFQICFWEAEGDVLAEQTALLAQLWRGLSGSLLPRRRAHR